MRWATPNPQTYIVQMENLSSVEVYLTPDGLQRPVLQNNTLDIRRGESWGIVGREAFELELLLQVIGCVRPYGSGRCKLVERGMMRKKRKILPHVFFVGDSGMAVPNMNVLEYLMFATQSSGANPRERQIELLDAMLQSDCYEWCFAPVKLLSKQERVVLSLVAASFSNALLYIFPYFFRETPPALRGMIRFVAQKVRSRGAAFLLGACDPSLVQDVCSHCAFLLDGTIRQKGTLDEVMRSLDRRDFMIRCQSPDRLREVLGQALAQYETRLCDGRIDLYHPEGFPLEQKTLLSLIADADIPVQSIVASERTLQNAFLEVSHDLSNEFL